MDPSQETLTALDELRTIRLEARKTRSLETLRRQFDRLQNIRRLYIDDFNVQVAVAEIHEEIVERARYLRGESPANALTPEETYGVFGSETVATRQASSQDDLPEAAQIPPEVPRLDAKSWQIAIGLAVFLTILVLAAFFYLIQTARKINFKDETAAVAAPQPVAPKSMAGNVSAPVGVPATASMAPTLRLYTDLIPGSVTFDDQAPRDIDGELVLDNLKSGQHSVKVVGSGGMAAFRFEVDDRAAPRPLGNPVVSNAMAVLVSVENGQGRLVTNAEHATVILDGKPAGEVDSKGLALTDLGKAEHDLRVIDDKDRQRFVLTYSPAPVLTVYVKSDPSVGTLVVTTGQDGVDVYVENTLYRRKTEHGQVRILLHAGKYKIHVHKAGFADPPPAPIEIKKAEETEIQFRLLAAAPEFATLQIKGAAPGMTISIDKEMEVTVGPDGTAQLADVKIGDRTIELRRDEYASKRFVRTFHAGETTLLAGADLNQEKLPTANQTGATPVASSETASTQTPASAQPEMSEATGRGVSEKVQKGGGFVPYGTPKLPGRYSFHAQARLGGFLKHGKLQWYAGYHDGQNYVLFTLDGKHASVREMADGKAVEQKRVSFSVPSNQWVQVELSVTADSIGARVRAPDGVWSEIGTVNSPGRNFTQDKVGLYVPENDEVAISNFRFSGR